MSLDDRREPLEACDSTTALNGSAPSDGGSVRRAGPFGLFGSISDRAGSLNIRRDPLDGRDVALETDLALLHEENARLRFERAQQPDAGRMLHRLRTLVATPSAGGASSADPHEEALHVATEALLMRDVLLEACQEIGQTMDTVQSRVLEVAPKLSDDAIADAPLRAGSDDRVEQDASLPLRAQSAAQSQQPAIAASHSGAVGAGLEVAAVSHPRSGWLRRRAVPARGVPARAVVLGGVVAICAALAVLANINTSDPLHDDYHGARLPTDRPSAGPARGALGATDTPQKAGAKVGGSVVSAGVDGCQKRVAAARAACPAGAPRAKRARHHCLIRSAGTSGGCAHHAPGKRPHPDQASARPDHDGVLTPGTRPAADRDGDGIPDRRDLCPNSPAATSSGCSTNASGDPTLADLTPAARPAADRDGDGIANRQDACPNKAANTPNGCPASAPGDPTPPVPSGTKADRDGDGIANRQDACPNKAANTPNGCPDSAPGDQTPPGRKADRDGDGIANRQDACPSTAADTPDGCPTRPA